MNSSSSSKLNRAAPGRQTKQTQKVAGGADGLMSIKESHYEVDGGVASGSDLEEMESGEQPIEAALDA